MPTIDQYLQTAVAHQQAGRPDQAAQICRHILAQVPNHVRALHLLGVLELYRGRNSQAIDLLGRAIRLEPRGATLHNDLGEAHRAAGNFDQAQACYRRSIQLNPNLAITHLNLGRVLRIKLQHDEAIRVLRRAIELEPDNFDAHHNLACALLFRGDYEQGWQEYTWRTRAAAHPGSCKTLPLWDGSPLAGRRLQIYGEQGFGDTLQFVRYLPLVEPAGGTVVHVMQPELISLLTSSGIENLVSTSTAAGRCDVQLPLLELPRLMGTTLETIPNDVPYLRVDAQLIEQWRGLLEPLVGVKVGIAWQGNKKYYLDRYRSIPLAEFEPLARVPGVRLIAVQAGDAANQADLLADRFEVARLDGFGVEPITFADTAAAMMNLDLIITSDTSTAHLAGGLGVPVWVALCASPDWRWMLERSDNPWYPTMRLFRQSQLGQWSEVFQSIAKALHEWRPGQK